MNIIKPSSIELKIVDSLKSKVNEFHSIGIKGDGKWTYYIKQLLGDLGHSEGFKTCTSGFRGKHESEWLYDLVWYRELGIGFDARLVEIPLVVESEWNIHFDYIKYDFEKLLLANAKQRLMICQSSADLKSERLNYFADAILKYELGHENDRFLIALLDVEDEEFYFELMVKNKGNTIRLQIN